MAIAAGEARHPPFRGEPEAASAEQVSEAGGVAGGVPVELVAVGQAAEPVAVAVVVQEDVAAMVAVVVANGDVVAAVEQVAVSGGVAERGPVELVAIGQPGEP